jgi:hypothetical protein
LTPNTVEVVVKAPMAARAFEPGQFYRLQNYEALAPRVNGGRLGMKGWLSLTPGWIATGLRSRRLCSKWAGLRTFALCSSPASQWC